MSISTVVTRGYGSGGSIAFIVTRGYTVGAAAAAGAAPALKKRGRRYEYITPDGKRISGTKEEVERFIAQYHSADKAEIVEVKRKPKPADIEITTKAPVSVLLPELPPLDAARWDVFAQELLSLNRQSEELARIIARLREEEDIIMLLMAA